ncbi:MAG TPA: VWA domain-containing protein [Pyrinomonadaceae bacterium]|nr:VWA domain-containing protein [Pyrinomonadaceae bacterium]
MKYNLFLAAITVFISIMPLAAQQPTSTPPEDQIVRISTDLIQIDVTVTDKNGKVVSGLGMDDFEIYENGEKKNVSGVQFMTKSIGGATLGGNASTATATARPGEVMSVTPQSPATPGSVRRTIAIVVDDLTMSFGSVYYARRALHRFVEQQMLPGDLVAIIRTTGSVGALQQFTSDKQVLRAAIDSIRWNPLTSEVEALTPIGQTAKEVSERFVTESNVVAQNAGQDSSGRLQNMKPHESITQTKARDFNDLKAANPIEAGVYAQASIGAMRYIVQGMNELPGRKLMMLFSDGYDIGQDSAKNRTGNVYQALQDLVEFANRSSVVVYTFDTRGLKSMSVQASDSTYEVIDGHRGQKEKIRSEDFKDKQDGLVYLAKQTGGQALLDSNDLNGGMRRFLDEQSAYYLLAYVPDAESFDPSKRKFNKLEVKVRRPDLKVAYRTGFFSTAPAGSQNSVASGQRELIKALTSPFSANQIAVNATSMFVDEAAAGSQMRSFLHINAKDLTFSDTTDGWKTASFDVGAIAFANNGVPVAQKEAEYTIKAKGETFETMMRKGFVYVLMVPMTSPGVYQYRVAVRDKESGKVGSSGQVIEIPDLEKRKLTLSSLFAENVSMSVWQNIAAGKVGNGPGQIKVPSTLLYDTVLRHFVAGSVLRYGLEAYNAKADGPMPKLETQAQILQNNAVIVEGSLNKVDASTQTDPKHVRISGAIMLKETLQPGDYLLKLTVFDRAAKQTATQIFPFVIVK